MWEFDAKVLSPGYDLKEAFDARFLDQINEFDRGEIEEEEAKNWKSKT